MSPSMRHQQEIIFIDVYTTQPQHQMRVADFLAQMLAATKNLYGNAYGRWLSGSIHKSVDGTRVVYECFSDRGTAQTIHAERHTQPVELALQKYAERDRHLYTPFPLDEDV